MKNNKGFSLVELIIVIAIMAILVGVLAPQLIKYIEKTNVSNDVQVCDTLRTAITTAMTDNMVVADPTYSDPSRITTHAGVAALVSQCGGATAQAKFQDVINTSIGVPSSSTADAYISTQLKSFGAKASTVTIEFNASSVLVWLPGTDMSGSKVAQSSYSSSNSSAIYAGPAATFGH